LKVEGDQVCIEIGATPILVHTDSDEFARLLEDRYGPFVVAAEENRGKRGKGEKGKWASSPSPRFPILPACGELEVELVAPGIVTDAEDARVRLEGGRWLMERGDFRVEWDPERREGRVRQTANPYSIDAVLRILHSLILAREGGFLVHAASAIRNGSAFLFAGASGAGKTTISRLAPPDVVLLTDEISYVRSQKSGVRSQESGAKGQEAEPLVNRRSTTTRHSSLVTCHCYMAFGTPFAGELARIGENLQAPVAGLYLLAQGRENRIESLSKADAARALLRNILFFAEDAELVRLVFQSALDFVSRVPVRRLVFAPDSRVWELIT